MKSYMEDTITAISTPLGEAGIGIVRLSGKDAIGIVGKLFRSKSEKKRSLHAGVNYGFIADGDKIIDEVLINVMKSPKSYTREDVVEINCHGGVVALKKTLQLTIRQGARVAERGEFTKRAFLNGRIDLSQASAVIETIRAKTDVSLLMAVSRLKGAFSEEIKKLKEKIIMLLADIEATIDFPEDCGDIDAEKIRKELAEIRLRIKEFIDSYEEGRIFREGVKIVIAGKPNSGKSSMMNALMREDRAIVTPVPGTTRDFIEECINIKGLPARLTDTAGIRTPDGAVEEEGIKRAKQKIADADLVIFLMDNSVHVSKEDYEIEELARNKKKIFVLNKIDLPAVAGEKELSGIADREKTIKTSAKYGTGIEELEHAIYEAFVKGGVEKDEDAITVDAREKAFLENFLTSVDNAQESLNDGSPPEIIAEDFRQGLEYLKEITGEITPEDVLDRIFSEFCIGK